MYFFLTLGLKILTRKLFISRTIALSFGAFQSLTKFTKELHSSFGNGLVVNGGITRADLTDYLLYLKDEYYTGSPKKFIAVHQVGYMGDDYWFLAPEVKLILKCLGNYICYFRLSQ